MGRLFIDCSDLPNLYSYGSSLRTVNYSDDAYDDLLALSLLIAKWPLTCFSYINAALFGTLEGFFFISSVTKFFHGGFVAVAMALVILSVMYIWHRSNRVQENASQDVRFKDYLPQLQELHDDEKIPYYQTNVVFWCRG